VIVSASAHQLPLADESVQCVVTSPPYWGLRKYAGKQDLIWPRPERGEFPFENFQEHEHDFQSNGELITRPDRSTGRHHGSSSGTFIAERGLQDAKNARGGIRPLGDTCTLCGAWRGGFGLEPTIEMYVSHTLTILRELRRVLRSDGVLFWNLGDSYNAKPNQRSPEDLSGVKQGTVRGSRDVSSRVEYTLKPKDLCLIPERVAIAAQADGWWVRSMIIWTKPNTMPESVTDRPTDAYEHIIMLTKSERYFWDAAAVREATSPNTHSRGQNNSGGPKAAARASEGVHVGWAESTREVVSARNLRNVWTFPTQPYKGAHFATFPEELPRRCILAATSAHGACSSCGAPHERVTEPATTTGKSWNGAEMKSAGVNRGEAPEMAGENFYKNYAPAKTIGWKPTCQCSAEVVPCTVLDPFGGSGTVGRVATELRRRAILCDVAYGRASEQEMREGKAYATLADRRTRNVQINLL
jgi:DNA modification methylase